MTSKKRIHKKKPVKHKNVKGKSNWSDYIFLYTTAVIVVVVLILAFVF